LRIWFCNFFLWNIVDCYSVSPQGFFPSKIIFILFYFLILSWLKITVTICEKNTITFSENYCPLLQCFFPYGFFYNFFQIILFNFIFLILSFFMNYNYKSLQIRLNHVGKHYSFHHKTLWIATVFPTWFFFLFLCFFCYFFKLSLSIFFNIELIKNLTL